LAPSSRLLDAAGVPYEAHARVGIPGETITQVAQELGCDLIAMGTKGAGAAASLLGSVVQSTLEASAVPLLLVK
jgi:nucleotide-binding universal stress UspA family protein